MGTSTRTAQRRRRVACFSPYPIEAPSLYHRIWRYREEWEAAGIDLEVWPFMTEELYRIRRSFGTIASATKAALLFFCALRTLGRALRVKRYDFIIIHREVVPLGPPLLEKWIARYHHDVTFDLDDAMWHPPSNAVFQRRRFWDPDRVAKVMAACRRVVAGNDYVRDYGRKHNDEVIVIPTPYDDVLADAGVAALRGDKPVVVWIGNLGNAGYVESIVPALEAVAAKVPFVLRLIGGADIADVDTGRLEVERLHWRREQESEWLRGSDVGIMPLHDLPFEQGKSAFKIVQYFSAGLPAVASPVGMNRRVIRHQVNGFLASDRDEWVDALLLLLSDAERRRRMAAEARRTYLEQFTRPANARRWLALWT